MSSHSVFAALSRFLSALRVHDEQMTVERDHQRSLTAMQD